MKLRIKNSSIRLRLTKSEVSRFEETGSISAVTPFGGGRTLTYTLQTSGNADAVTASFGDAHISVIVPAAMAHHWASTENVSIRAEQGGGGERLQIVIEKDLQCLHKEDTKRDADAYPHPLVENVPDSQDNATA
jgi:hypothetical protein